MTQKCDHCGKPVQNHPGAKVYHLECAMELAREQRERKKKLDKLAERGMVE